MPRIRWGILIAALVGIVYLGWSLLHASTAPENDLEPQRAAVRNTLRPDALVGPKRLAGIVDATADSRRGIVGGSDAGTSAAEADDPEVRDGGPTLGAYKQMLAKNAEAAARNVDRFCELSRKVSKVKAFLPPAKATATSDAALFLAGRVDWEGGSVGTLHLPKSLTDRMASGAWVRMGAVDYAGLDFGWLTVLLEYDTWSISTTGPVHDLASTSYLEAPIPNFISLQHWSKLRLVKGLRESDSARASLEVRHLADLCGSTHILIGEMIRLAIYGIERKFYEDLGLPAPDGMPSADDALAYRRTAFAGMYFLYPGVSKEVREKALACSAARCSSMNEALGMSAAARDLLPEARETMNWLLTQSPCAPAFAEQIARSRVATEENLAKQVEDNASLDDLLTFDAGVL